MKSLSKKQKRQVFVFLPNKQRLDCNFGLKSRGQDVLAEVLEQLDICGLQIFGLALLRDNEYLFIDLDEKLAKYFGQSWRKASKMGPSVLFLRVQFYIESGRLIQTNGELRLYFTALRQKVLRSQSRQQEAVFFQLASCALQAEVGDLEIQGKHKHYFLPEDYFPSWLIKRRSRDYLLQHSPKLHEDLRGMSQKEAVLEFVKLANTLEDVPVTVYKMKKVETGILEQQRFSICFGVGPNGVCLYQDVEGRQYLMHDFAWKDLEHISFKLVFYSHSALHSTLLLKHLRDSHRVTISVRNALSLVRQMEQIQACSFYREAYIYDTRLHCSAFPMTHCSIELETTTHEEQMCEEDSSVHETEEICVDSPDDVSLLGVPVDGPSAPPTPDWTAVTLEMNKVLKKRSDIAICAD
ncbi:hypothetical protein WMY93_010762 [Mugilogobius chulae]|uniref:FERM domain-containing protein n=1 Tax=Mugilogobius chulae TaxID=88201 RepID=A0AAW0P8B9_9GOBI